MNIVYYSNIFFSDCDVPLIRQYQRKGHRVLYFIEVAKGRLAGGLFNIKSTLPKHGIVNVTSLDEFKPYKDYINLNDVFLIVRTGNVLDFRNWFMYIKLACQVARFRPQAFHISQALGLVESILYLFKNIMVMTVHDPFLHSGEECKWVEKKRIKSFRNASKLVLLNQKQRCRFVEHYGIDDSKVFLNRLGVYECLKIRHRVESLYNKEDYILFFGHFSPYKGIDVLCEAMNIVHQECPSLKCLIAGKGTLNFDCSPYIEKEYINIENRFIELDELSTLIDRSLFVVCPYKDATQSGVVFSSFALCKPVIASNVGGLGESIIDDVTGKLVEPNNPLKLAEAIIEMYRNKERLNIMSSNIKEKYYNGNLSWSSIADNYIKIYGK